MLGENLPVLSVYRQIRKISNEKTAQDIKLMSEKAQNKKKKNHQKGNRYRHCRELKPIVFDDTRYAIQIIGFGNFDVNPPF
mmetsp:Transcript_4601/g.5814  ORF Transcript_4601/g.5814 Transcript_4601/m.5814 type:complete len:81 (-) Transcript_4601:1037-1279(-)